MDYFERRPAKRVRSTKRRGARASLLTLLTASLTLVACGGDDGPFSALVSQTEDTTDPSVAKRWSEVLLGAIRNDLARPTVHARNLFTISSAMWDAWAIYDNADAETYLLGKTLNGFSCPLNGFSFFGDRLPMREEAISYAVYRIINHRFAQAPGVLAIQAATDALMNDLGFDPTVVSVDAPTQVAADMGNYIAQCYIDYGAQDGANEANNYGNVAYMPINPPLAPAQPGNPDIVYLDRWQPLELVLFIDQAGNPISGATAFLNPEWGQVLPFALNDADSVIFQRDGFDYVVYHDPGAPPTFDSQDYKYMFELVSIWSSHLDQNDGVMIDISPASIGNVQNNYPQDFGDYANFYDLNNGGYISPGYATNPATGAAYEPQIVPRGDYTRVLAEFWADGPESETPPGHWFVIMNTVNDHPDLEKRIGGAGPVLGPLEWDVKGYFALGGAVHDAAITAWGIKGWYDYIRPVSAIRAMADRGQSSDPALASYSVGGISLHPGFIELVEIGDPLAGAADEHVGKIKVLAWRGPDFIANPLVDQAGVAWILAENWWPYQRPTFVTPPFAGYISGHSTYSRAAAEVMTALTGDPFFPGGMSGFEVFADEFLVFEEGPSVGMTLEWATYRDASDQCSLSRIWGGIHPPVDDIPGRIIGEQLGISAYALAETYF